MRQPWRLLSNGMMQGLGGGRRACQRDRISPPVARARIAYFLLLLHDSVRRELKKMHFVACRRGPGRRSNRASSVPITLHECPVHVPTANAIGFAIFFSVNFLV